MDFFQKFGALAKSLEKDLKDIKDESMNCVNFSLLSEQEKEEKNNKAVVVARELQKDVKSLKKEIRQCKSSIEDDGGFLQLVELSENLLKKQAESVNSMEQYLQQYGYQPLTPSSYQKQTDTNELSIGSHKYDTNIKEHSSKDKEETSPDDLSIDNADSCTPEKSSAGVSHSADVIKTPKLEDFGLSKDILNYYKDLGAALRKQIETGKNATTCDSVDGAMKPPADNAPEMNGNQMRSHGIESNSDVTPTRKFHHHDREHYNNNVPEAFDHTGLVPTPGFTGGRDRNDSPDQNDSIPSVTPQVLRSRNSYLSEKASENNASSSESGDFTKDLHIPAPPVLNTPGVKQLSKPVLVTKAAPVPKLNLNDSNDIQSPVPPVLQTPGVKQIKKPPVAAAVKPNGAQEDKIAKLDLDIDQEFDSPVPPVMCTPGFKQLSKPKLEETKAQLKPRVNSDDDIDIPDIPELTYTWNDIQMIRSQYDYKEAKEPVQTSDSHSLSTNTETSQSAATKILSEPITILSGIENTHFTKKDTPIEDKPVPEMPELTGVYNFSDISLSCDSPISLKEKPKVSTFSRSKAAAMFNKLNPVITRDQNIEDCPIPQMPELTGVYSFTKSEKENEEPDSKQNAYEQKLSEEDTANDSSKDESSKQRTVEYVTLAEYEKQPDYVHRLISLDLLNQTVDVMENFFAQQTAENMPDCFITETDLHQVLGTRTKSVLLVMIRLGRLKQKKSHENVYVPL